MFSTSVMLGIGLFITGVICLVYFTGRKKRISEIRLDSNDKSEAPSEGSLIDDVATAVATAPEMDMGSGSPCCEMPDVIAEAVVEASAISVEGSVVRNLSDDGTFAPVHNNFMAGGNLDAEQEEKIISKIANLPPLPRATLDLLPLLSSQNTDARDIAKVIKTDPLLAGKLLRRVNSSFYGFEFHINSLQQAVSLLGFNSIRTLSLRESFDSIRYHEPIYGLTANLLWRHMAAISLFSRHLAINAHGVDPDLASSAGLLHDIGLLVMMAVDKDKLSDALKLSTTERLPLCECEEKVMGYNHQVLGYYLGRSWNLSDELCGPIGKHHSPFSGEGADKIAGIIWLAHSLAAPLGFAYRNILVTEEEGQEMALAIGLRWPIDTYINQNIIRELQRVLNMWDPMSKDPSPVKIR